LFPDLAGLEHNFEGVKHLQNLLMVKTSIRSGSNPKG
jgi:hypothetical protein